MAMISYDFGQISKMAGISSFLCSYSFKEHFKEKFAKEY